jgi:hypothetical protein
MSKFTFPNHPRMGWNVFVNIPNKQIKFFISIATQLFKVRVRLVDSLEEAHQFLEYVDQTIVADQP